MDLVERGEKIHEIFVEIEARLAVKGEEFTPPGGDIWAALRADGEMLGRALDIDPVLWQIKQEIEHRVFREPMTEKDAIDAIGFLALALVYMRENGLTDTDGNLRDGDEGPGEPMEYVPEDTGPVNAPCSEGVDQTGSPAP